MMMENTGAGEAPRSSGGNDSEPSDGGRNRFGNRNRRNNQGGRKNNIGNIRSQGTTTGHIEGSEPSLKGFIYDFTGERDPDQFIKTTKQIKQYVRRTYTKFPAEFMLAIDDLLLTDPEVSERPDSYQDVFAMEEWKMDLKDYRVKAVEYMAFRSRLYNVVIRQCTDALQDKLKSHPDFEGDK